MSNKQVSSNVSQLVDDIVTEVINDICMNLCQKNHDYEALNHEQGELIEKMPFIEKIKDGDPPASLSTDEIAALSRYMAISFEMKLIEVKAIYFRGQSDFFGFLNYINAF
jgi:hypothetical protein